MKLWRTYVAVAACLGTVACGRNPPETPTTQPAPGEARITGSERIGWDQQAASATELAALRYAIYVDGARSELTEVSCATASGPAGFPCSGRLPSMTPGSHTLELAAFVVEGGVLESSRSAPLQVLLAAATATAVTTGWQRHVVLTTSDHVRLLLERVTDGLASPSDLAFAPDGRVFVAERGGQVRLVQEGRLRDQVALSLDDVSTAGGGGLLAMALDPQFQRNGFVYTLYTAQSRRAAASDQVLVFRLVRFREVNGLLAQRAVLLDSIPAASARPAASLRFGPDNKLYVAFDDGGNERLSGDLASFNGKILRLNADGTTPPDQAAATPVYGSDLRAPRGFDWQPADATLWIADSMVDGLERLMVVNHAHTASRRRSIGAGYALPRPTGTSGVAFYGAGLIPSFRGDLLIAAEEGQQILRLRFDSTGQRTIIATERLIQNSVGPIRVVAVSPRGEIYFCTNDALGRLIPAQS